MTMSQPETDPPRLPPPPPASPVSPPPLPPELPMLPLARRRSDRWIVVLVLLGVALAVVGLAVWRHVRRRAPERPPRERVADKHREISRAFGEGRAGPSEAETRKIEALLLSIGRHVKAKDFDRAVRAFNVERMLQEVRRFTGGPEIPRGKRASVVASLRRGLRDGFRDGSSAYGWERVEIKHIRGEDRRGEFVVYARHRDPDQGSSYIRWWVTKSRGPWRVYDFEFLLGGVRSSVMMAVLAGEAKRGRHAWKGVLDEDLPQVIAAMGAGELDRADELFVKIHRASLPKEFEALFWMLTAALRIEQSRFKEALDCTAKAEARNPDMPLLLLFRASAFNGLGRFAEALPPIREYRKLFGADADSSVILGRAYVGLGKYHDACLAYREGLRDDPDSVANLTGLGVVLPVDLKEEVGSHFAKFARPKESFEAIATEFLGHTDDRALGALVEAYRKIAPKDTAADYYAARVHIMRREFRQAADVIQAALPRVSDKEKRGPFVECYLDAMLLLDEPLAGYRNSPDKDHAFGYIASALVDGSGIMSLAALIQAHRSRRPKDIWLDYYTGEMHLLGREYDQGAKAHRAGWKRAADAHTRETFRVGYVYALYRAGKAVEAYRTVGPRDATFAQLARLHWGDNDADGLDALVGEAYKADPKHRALPLWRAAVHSLRKQYAPAVKLLRDNRKAMLAEEDDLPRFEGVLIDSLVFLKRFADALQAARASTARDGDPFYEAVVHAAMGNAAETAALLEKLIQKGYVTAQLYANSHLRKALSSDAFREVRKRFPPPEQPAGSGRKGSPDDL